jgi:hypothetical protein
VALLGLLQRQGWGAWQPIATLGTIAYLGLVVFWAWAAWRVDLPAAAPLARAA